LEVSIEKPSLYVKEILPQMHCATQMTDLELCVIAIKGFGLLTLKVAK
jgi:hypothetical protein